MIVDEVMSKHPYAASVTSSIRHVLRILAEADVRHVPIVDNDRLVGMVSDRDLRSVLPNASKQFQSSSEVERLLSEPIGSVMNGDLVCLNSEDELAEAADLMIEQRIGAVPVVEPGSMKLIGIISYVDLLRAARDAL